MHLPVKITKITYKEPKTKKDDWIGTVSWEFKNPASEYDKYAKKILETECEWKCKTFALGNVSIIYGVHLLVNYCHNSTNGKEGQKYIENTIYEVIKKKHQKFLQKLKDIDNAK